MLISVSFFPQIVLVDDERSSGDQADGVRHPVDLQLEWVLGKMPQKEFKLERLALTLQPLTLPAGLTVKDALQRVLRLPSVASKRYLTNKVFFLSHSCLTLLLSVEINQTLCDSLFSLPPTVRWTGL